MLLQLCLPFFKKPTEVANGTTITTKAVRETQAGGDGGVGLHVLPLEATEQKF